jgi:hypothetical protein
MALSVACGEDQNFVHNSLGESVSSKAMGSLMDISARQSKVSMP